ncbi:MAG: CARDB domain-containing protein [Thermoplasmatota archaeon]
MMRFLAAVTIAFVLIPMFALTIGSDAQPAADYEKPDLMVTHIAFRDPDENHMNAGERTHVTITITNEGWNYTGSGWTVTVYDNDRLVEEESVYENLAPGELYYFDFTYKLRSGERDIRVIVDSEDVVEESVEENNELITRINVEEADPVVYWWVVCIPIVCVPFLFLSVFASIIFALWRTLRKEK